MHCNVRGNQPVTSSQLLCDISRRLMRPGFPDPLITRWDKVRGNQFRTLLSSCMFNQFKAATQCVVHGLEGIVEEVFGGSQGAGSGGYGQRSMLLR